MDQSLILYPDRNIAKGHLYHNQKMDKIEASIPTPFHTNHAAYLLETSNGDLLCTWFAGSEEGAGDIRIVLSRLEHDSASWTSPAVIANDAQQAQQNPSLFQAPTGDIWLLYTSMETRGCSLQEWQRRLDAGEAEGPFAMQHTARVMRSISRDFGHTWEPAEVLFDEAGSFCRQPIQVMSNGTWLFGTWRSEDPSAGFGTDRTFIHRSTDKGQSWVTYEVPGSQGRVHANLIELGECHIAAFFRSRSADNIYISHSYDDGQSWSVPVRTDLPNNNASISAIKLSSGRIAIVYNDIRMNDDTHVTLWPYERYPITIALSEDGGRTWPYRRHVHAGDGYCGEANRTSNRRYEYPCILQTSDGLIHVAFSSETRTFIEYTCFTEPWIIGSEKPAWPWRNFPLR